MRRERLSEITERSRGQRDVCMRDQDGGQGDGTRESSVSETNSYDCHSTKNASTRTTYACKFNEQQSKREGECA